MANLSIERLQAPSGGSNSDASPDYVPGTQAPELVNLLPGSNGKAQMRGPIIEVLAGLTDPTFSRPDAFWHAYDLALVKGDAGSGTKVWQVNVAAMSATDVTATIGEVPLDYRYVMYGTTTYGGIVDAVSPALGRWTGGTITQQTNAPYGFTDLQAYAKRLFVLGGSVPGTTTPIKTYSLFYSDPRPDVADLALVGSWTDDVTGLINRIDYDSDDTPVALANCGRFMAILGSRSINILTGTGSSSFAVKNLTKDWGCSDRNSVVEYDDGLYFMSDRGYSFCDGSSVRVVSDNKITTELNAAGDYTAASFGRGYVALCSQANRVACWLFNRTNESWTKLAIGSGGVYGVFRTNSYPVLFQEGRIWRAEDATAIGTTGLDNNGGGGTQQIPATWRSRFVSLSGPSAMAVVQRILLDYKFWSLDLSGAGGSDAAFRVQVYDGQGNELADETCQAQDDADVRQRFQFDCFAEADAVQLLVTAAGTADVNRHAVEVYDAWVEYVPAQSRATR